MRISTLAFLLLLHTVVISSAVTVSEEGFCIVNHSQSKPISESLYWKVTNPTLSPTHLQDLPGFTRSIYRRDHALITPESHVFSPLTDWVNAVGAYLISPALGSHFTMYLVKMQEDSRSALPAKGIERFIFVLQGSCSLSDAYGITHPLDVDFYAYFAANSKHVLRSDSPSTLIIFERRYVSQEGFYPEEIISSTDRPPLLETPGEVFELRKLLPTSLAYDFNIHESGTTALWSASKTEMGGIVTGCGQLIADPRLPFMLCRCRCRDEQARGEIGCLEARCCEGPRRPSFYML